MVYLAGSCGLPAVAGGAVVQVVRQLLFQAALDRPQPPVQALLPQQLVVRADLGDAPVLQHDDPVGLHQRREAVGDDQRRPPAVAAPQGRQDQRLRPRVHGAEGVVQDQDGRVLEHCPRQAPRAAAARRTASRPARPPACRSRPRRTGWTRRCRRSRPPRRRSRRWRGRGRSRCSRAGSWSTGTVPGAPRRSASGRTGGPAPPAPARRASPSRRCSRTGAGARGSACSCPSRTGPRIATVCPAGTSNVTPFSTAWCAEGEAQVAEADLPAQLAVAVRSARSGRRRPRARAARRAAWSPARRCPRRMVQDLPHAPQRHQRLAKVRQDSAHLPHGPQQPALVGEEREQHAHGEPVRSAPNRPRRTGPARAGP